MPTGTAASLPTSSPVPAPPDPAADAGVIVPIAVAFVAGIGALAWLLRRRTVS